MHRTSIWIGFALLCVVPTELHAQTSESPFLIEVQRSFANWDRDKNGELSREELEQAIVNPKIVGDEAAAIATLFSAVRSTKTPDLPKLTLDNIVALVPRPKDGRKLPDFQAMYKGNLSRVKGNPRGFFTEKEVNLDDIHQGALGDCWCMAIVGWVAYHKPATVKEMFYIEANDHVLVKFPSGQSEKIATLSDGEIAVMSRTGNEGTWSDYIEKAVGARRMVIETEKANATAKADMKPNAKTKTPDKYALTSVAHGGSMVLPIELFTGNKAVRFSTKLASPEKSEELLTELRTRLATAEKSHQIMGASVHRPADALVPGLTNDHAYACLKYDADADEVTLWNPHGNTFKPAGPSGIENGYPTKKGIFKVPVAQAVKIFAAFVFETDVRIATK